MPVEVRRDFRSHKDIARLFAGVFLPPIAFLFHLQINFILVPFSCAAGNEIAMHIVSIVCLIVAAAGGLIAWLCWREAGEVWPGEGEGAIPRSRLMAAAGMAFSALFFLIILGQMIASIILGVCQ